MEFNVPLENWTSNQKLRDWILANVEKCSPKSVHLCDGSEEENKKLLRTSCR